MSAGVIASHYVAGGSSLLSAMLADGPWGLWMCNEASGSTLADSSGNGRSLSVTGSLAAYQQQPFGGITAGGISFPSGTAVSASGSATPTTTGGYTFACWFYLTANPTATLNLAAMLDASNARGFRMQVTTAGLVQWNLINSGGPFVTSGTVNLNAWNLAVGFSNGTSGYVRLNKASSVSTTGSTATSFSSTFMRLHRTGTAISTLPCIIGPNAFYETQLSDAAVDVYYDAV